MIACRLMSAPDGSGLSAVVSELLSDLYMHLAELLLCYLCG